MLQLLTRMQFQAQLKPQSLRYTTTSKHSMRFKTVFEEKKNIHKFLLFQIIVCSIYVYVHATFTHSIQKSLLLLYCLIDRKLNVMST